MDFTTDHPLHLPGAAAAGQVLDSVPVSGDRAKIASAPCRKRFQLV